LRITAESRVSRLSVSVITSSKAALVGANTVSSPGFERISAAPARVTSSTKMERSGSCIARSTMVPPLCVSAGAESAGASVSGPRIAWGNITPSILWITPLDAGISTELMDSSFTNTPSAFTWNSTVSPWAVGSVKPSVISLAM